MADLFSDVDVTPRSDDAYVRRARLHLPRVMMAGLVVPPLAWILHQQASYAFATLWCDGPTLLLHGLTVVLLGVVVSTAWRVYRFAGLRITPDAGDPEPGLGRFVGLLAIVGAALASTAIVAQGIPNFLLAPCH